jgi:hypothetical protein
MFNPLECRLRASECQKMAEHAPTLAVRAALEDMAHTWNRLAVEAEILQSERRNARLSLVNGSNPPPPPPSPRGASGFWGQSGERPEYYTAGSGLSSSR